MYCVIQEIETRKKSKGNPKELKTYETTFTINGETETTYGYCHGEKVHFMA